MAKKGSASAPSQSGKDAAEQGDGVADISEGTNAGGESGGDTASGLEPGGGVVASVDGQGAGSEVVGGSNGDSAPEGYASQQDGATLGGQVIDAALSPVVPPVPVIEDSPSLAAPSVADAPGYAVPEFPKWFRITNNTPMQVVFSEVGLELAGNAEPAGKTSDTVSFKDVDQLIRFATDIAAIAEMHGWQEPLTIEQADAPDSGADGN